MAYSANGYNFTNKTLSRVKYDILIVTVAGIGFMQIGTTFII